MKTLKPAVLAALITVSVGCGYGSKNYAPTPGAMPAISQLNPANTNAGGSAFTLTVNGSNFAAAAVVNWNGAAQTSGTKYVSTSQLTLAVPASMISTSGTVQVTVTNPATQGTGMYGSGGTTAETSTAVNFMIN